MDDEQFAELKRLLESIYNTQRNLEERISNLEATVNSNASELSSLNTNQKTILRGHRDIAAALVDLRDVADKTNVLCSEIKTNTKTNKQLQEEAEAREIREYFRQHKPSEGDQE